MYSPDYDLNAETYFLASALYDIRSAEHNMASTSPSFESHDRSPRPRLVTRASSTPRKNKPKLSIAEGIIWHHGIGHSCKITVLAALIQSAALLDKVGANVDLVS